MRAPAYNSAPNSGFPVANPAYPSATTPATPGGYPAGYPNSGQGFGSPGGPVGRTTRDRGRRGQRPVQQSRADDDPHAHRRSASRSAAVYQARRNYDGQADVRRRRELRCRPGGEYHARRAELRLDEGAHQLGRHHGRPRLPRRRREVPLGTGPARRSSATWSASRSRTSTISR